MNNIPKHIRQGLGETLGEFDDRNLIMVHQDLREVRCTHQIEDRLNIITLSLRAVVVQQRVVLYAGRCPVCSKVYYQYV